MSVTVSDMCVPSSQVCTDTSGTEDNGKRVELITVSISLAIYKRDVTRQTQRDVMLLVNQSMTLYYTPNTV